MWWPKEKHVQTSETWADSPVKAELSPDGSEPVELGQGINLWWNCWWTWRQCHTHHQCVKPFEPRGANVPIQADYTTYVHFDNTGWLYTLTIQQVHWLTRYRLSLTIIQVDFTTGWQHHHHCHLHVRRGSKWVNSLYVIGWHQPFDHLVKLLLASL